MPNDEKIRIGIIGDTHGRDYWKHFVDEYNNEIDLWIFLGDFVDSYDISNIDIIDNLKNIIQFKRENMDRVILLLGNHCISYIYGGKFRCSGFRPEIAHDLYKLYSDNFELFEVIHTIDKHIFTHAGISQRWFKKYKKDINIEFKNLQDKFKLTKKHYSLFEKINWMQHSEKGRDIIFSVCSLRSDNPYNIGGIVWVDKRISQLEPLPGYHQYVGHSPVQDFETYIYDKGKTSITYCDVLGTIRRFKTIEI